MLRTGLPLRELETLDDATIATIEQLLEEEAEE